MGFVTGLIVGLIACYFAFQRFTKKNEKENEKELAKVNITNKSNFWDWCKVIPNNKLAAHIKLYVVTSDVTLNQDANLASHIEKLNKIENCDHLFVKEILVLDSANQKIIYQGPQIHGQDEKYIMTHYSNSSGFESVKVTLEETDVQSIQALEKIVSVINVMCTSEFDANVSYIDKTDIDLINQFITKLR